MYRRVSSKRNRDDQGMVSLPEQWEALQKLPEDAGYEIVGEYYDAIGEQPRSTTSSSGP